MQRRTLLKLLGAVGLPLPAAVAAAEAKPVPSPDLLREITTCVKAVEEIKDGIIDLAVAELNALGLECRFSDREVDTERRATWRCAAGRPATQLYANLTLHNPPWEDWTAHLELDTVKGTLAVKTWSPVFPDGFRTGGWERDPFDPFKLHRI